MAIKKFNKDQLSRGKSILNPDDNFNPDDFTYDVITEFESNPRKENLPKVIEVIEMDSSLPAIQKEILIKVSIRYNSIQLCISRSQAKKNKR